MDPEDMSVSTSSIDSCQHQIRELGGTLEDTNNQLRSLLLLMAPDISNSIPFHLDSLDMFEFLLSISDKIQNSKQQIKKLSDDFQKHADKANSTTAENVEKSMEVPKVQKKSTKRVGLRCSFPEPNIVLGRRELYNKSSCNKDKLHSGWKSEVKEITCSEQQPELKDAKISPVDQDLCTNLRRGRSCIDLSKYVKLDTQYKLINSDIIKEDSGQMVGQIIRDLITSLDLVPTVVKDCDLVFRIEDVIETLRAKKAKKRSRISSRIMSGFRRIRKVITRSFTVCLGRKNTF